MNPPQRIVVTRVPFRARAATAVLALAALAGCTTAPWVGSKRATEYTPDELTELAEGALRDGDPGRAAMLAEFVLRNDFDHPKRGRVRWVAAEGRFGAGDYPDALIHYRRTLEDDPLSPKAAVIVERLWTIGKTLIREKASWLPDFSSRHDVGVEALDLLVAQFPEHELADDAWRELAIAFREDELHQAAADCFERLARDFPRGEWADYALYNVAEEYYALSRGHEYDIDPLLVAWGALGRYLEVYPDGNFAESAREQRRTIESEVTRRELAIADYYRFKQNVEGERIHLVNAARRFPSAPEAREAARIVAERGLDGRDSADLLKHRTDRPKWAAATEKGVLDESEAERR